MPVGRPTSYTPELAAEICAEFSINPRATMKSVAEKFNVAPSSIFLWLTKHDSFSESYARAKQEQADLLVDEMIEISDDAAEDWETRVSRSGEEYLALNKDAVQRSRLMIDTRKWIASKLKPKKYGDKIDVTSQGKGIQPVIVVPAESDESEWETFDDDSGKD